MSSFFTCSVVFSFSFLISMLFLLYKKCYVCIIGNYIIPRKERERGIESSEKKEKKISKINK